MSRLRGATPEAERPGNLHWPLHGGWPLRSHHVRYGPRTIRWQERDVRDPWAYSVATALHPSTTYVGVRIPRSHTIASTSADTRA